MENNIQIFNNPEFGNIRTTMIDGEPWFAGKDVSTALGYSNPQKAVRDHVSEEDRGVNEMDTPSGKQNLVLINESGLYALIFGSKLDSANKFKRWVTKEVLPSIRKTGSYGTMSLTIPQQIQIIAQGTVELTQKVDALEEKVERFELDLPILPIEADRITEAVKKKGTAVLGGKQSNAYANRSVRQKVYANIYSTIKYQFRVKSYKAIRRNQMDKVTGIIDRYEPPVFLKDEIDVENAQEKICLN